MLNKLLDLVAPRFCVVCGNRLAVSEDYVCSVCNLHLPRTGFQSHADDNQMVRMLWGLMPVERATALFYYAPGTQTTHILETLKYNDQPEIGITMGRLMAQELKESGFFDGIDLIIPIPLARSRQRQRGYNQCTMLARGVSEATGIQVVESVVIRERFEKSQTRLDRWERLENVEGLFALRNPQSLRGKHVLLIDDVMTTGATVCSCSQPLQQVEGLRISVLTLAFAKS